MQAASAEQPHGELSIAAASNLTQVAKTLGDKFEAEANIHCTFSFGATAELTQQIENGAPFDLFLSADASHVKELQDKGLLAEMEGRQPYAVGILALWVPPKSKVTPTRIQDVTRPDVKVIAMAKPELAPYGQAAMESLQHAGIWEIAKNKVAYAENISMARQFGTSGNADVVFTAKALVLGDGGTIIDIDDSMHAPIVQELGIMAKSPHVAEARKFVQFLRQGDGQGN